MKEIAKFLRKLRIDNNGENLGEMADKLDFSAAYLSAIENGKRAIPEDMQERVFKNYVLTEEQKLEFSRIVAESREKVEIGLKDIQEKELFPEYVDTAVLFAHDLSQMNRAQLEEVRSLLLKIKTEEAPM